MHTGEATFAQNPTILDAEVVQRFKHDVRVS